MTLELVAVSPTIPHQGQRQTVGGDEAAADVFGGEEVLDANSCWDWIAELSLYQDD